MSLVRRKPQQPPDAPDADEDMIDVKEAARILGLESSTVRKGLAGTGDLMRVRMGNSQKPRIRFLRSEVESFKQRLIDNARAQQRHHLSLVYDSES